MHRNTALALIVSTLLSAGTLSANAEDAPKTTPAAIAEKTTPAAGEKATPAASEKKSVSKTTAKKSSDNGVLGIPASIASFTVGTLVGIPVQMVRKSKVETVNATKDLVGENNNIFLLGAAGILGVPAGIISGTMQSFVWAPLNAWKGTANEPFSAEAFSLGDAK